MVFRVPTLMGLFTDFRFFASFHLSRGLKLGGRTHIKPSSRCSVWSWIWHHSATTVFGRSSLLLLLDASWALRAAWACRICRQIMENRLKTNTSLQKWWLEDIFSFKNSHLSVVIGSLSGGISVHISKIWSAEAADLGIWTLDRLGLLRSAPWILWDPLVDNGTVFGWPLRFWPIDRLQDMWINLYIYIPIRILSDLPRKTGCGFCLLPFVIFQSIMFCLKDSNDIWMNVLCNHGWCMTHSMGTQTT